MNNIAIEQNTQWTFPHCPTPANLQINWTEILAIFPSLQSLTNCEQNPIYHAEGNVWIHTQLVCEALVSLTAWQAVNITDRSILFAAALLHDIAKPLATQVTDDGNITAKGHVNLGAKMVRQILQDLQTPFTIRESIVAIVKYGSLPLWFWDKQNPLKSIIKASQLVRCDWLALMAEADVKGRICDDRQKLLETIEFFKEFCQEHNCFDRTYPFASAHSRFIYFHKEDGDPTYAAFDDTRLEVIMMCGLPGTGKDYWIDRNHPDLPVVSLDKLRIEMGILPTNEQGAIVNAGRALAKGYLQSETPFIWNATNIVKPIRLGLIRLFAGYGARIRIVYLEVPIDRVLRQNRDRKAQVPNAVIHRFRDRLEIPDLTEAHQVDYFVDV
ncbi:AAA family ATPase [Chamaesiphon sp. GL140_3_metabinner_50]|uniref:AAA family ATPase n=1 Tax=Chamaesiphon sp. GL140_3_metabinner_50 TaxID=2970812 RepID=UPI0025CD3EF8|nr:AAA family ATPase [Chamaesiphon sp. GL140_3_metabinner_50]